jgi:iron complex transport system permease protein
MNISKSIKPVLQEFRISNTTKLILFAIPVIFFFLSFCFGRYWVAPDTVVSILGSKLFGYAGNWTTLEESVIINMRLPRILLSMLVGAGLSVSGASFQGMFGNPLVSPQILGVAAGAGFGAALGIIISGQTWIVQLLAMIFGFAAVGITYMISRIRGGSSTIFMLVLAGVITGAFFEALISALKYTADPFTKLPAITYWLMGSMSGASYKDLIVVAPLILMGIIILTATRWRLNVLSLNEDEARSLGVNLNYSRGIVIISSTVITAAAVSVCGIIGWVGLVIPHICRIIVGPDHKHLIPACLSIGATYLLVIDTIARSALSLEIPLSILTAIVGAPFFAFLLKRSGGEWR